MPRKQSPRIGRPPSPELLVSREEAENRLRTQIDKGGEILRLQISDENDLETSRTAYYKWSAFNQELLKRIFDNDSFAREYAGVAVVVGTMFDTALSAQVGHFHWVVQEKIDQLDSILGRLELIPVSSSASSVENAVDQPHELGSDVFIVHGSDDAARETVARFIEMLDLKAVILREQPNAGRTLIEKFEHYANVGFAVVLMTPDDVGSRSDQQENLQSRARQNVIFELGFFIGKLGRHRVCALYAPGVEIPTDYSGVGYLPMDEPGAWKLNLAKEIKTAGIPLDLNKAM